MSIKNKNIIVFMFLILIFSFSGCKLKDDGKKLSPSQKPIESVKTLTEIPSPISSLNSEKPGWETKTENNGMATYEIPKDWKKNEEISFEGVDFYAPTDTQGGNKSSTIMVQMSKNGHLAPEYYLLKENFHDGIESQLKARLPNSQIVHKNDYEMPFGYVFEMVLIFEEQGEMIKQTEYYYFVDNYLCTVISADLGDNSKPDVTESGKHVINSMVFAKYVPDHISKATPEPTNEFIATEDTLDLGGGKGKWDGNLYESPNISLSFVLPDGWDYLGWDEINRNFGPKALDSTEVFANSPDNKIIQIYVEKSIGEITLEEYVEIVKRQMSKSKSKTYTINNVYREKIGDKEFTGIDSTSVDSAGIAFTEYAFVHDMGDSFLCITAICPSTEQVEMIKVLKENIK